MNFLEFDSINKKKRERELGHRSMVERVKNSFNMSQTFRDSFIIKLDGSFFFLTTLESYFSNWVTFMSYSKIKIKGSILTILLKALKKWQQYY